MGLDLLWGSILRLAIDVFRLILPHISSPETWDYFWTGTFLLIGLDEGDPQVVQKGRTMARIQECERQYWLKYGAEMAIYSSF